MNRPLDTSPQVITFGCRLNTYESEVIRMHAESAGETDVVYVNTCAVTAESERQARQSIRRLRREHPDMRIVVTGCSAQLNPQAYSQMDEVDSVLGNAEKLDPQFFGQSNMERVQVNDIMSVKQTAQHMITTLNGRVRSFLQVQNGCNHRCTFCIIPYARGHARSVPMGAVVQQIQQVIHAGGYEIVLTGVDLTGYGCDLPGAPTLGQMVRRIFRTVPKLPRLRLSSLDPAEIDSDLWDMIAHEPRLMPHFHLSLQSGDDIILKRMKRRHTSQDMRVFSDRVFHARPEAALGADIIAGFPTETEAHFQNTLKIIETCDISYCHVFPFSRRTGTPAARIPESRHVPQSERKRRAALLRHAGEKRFSRLLDRMIGSRVVGLAEKPDLLRAPNFAPIIPTQPCVPGTLYALDVTGRRGQSLSGSIVSKTVS